MARRERLIEKLKRRPPHAEFSDVRQLLELCEWTFARQSSSHAMFTRAGQRTLTVPLVSGRKVKGTYIKQILGLLGLDD